MPTRHQMGNTVPLECHSCVIFIDRDALINWLSEQSGNWKHKIFSKCKATNFPDYWQGRDSANHNCCLCRYEIPVLLPGQPQSEDITQTSLEYRQARSLTHLLGSLFHCLTTLMVKNFFLISCLNLPWHSFCAIPVHPVIGYQGEETSTSLSTLLRKV